MATSRNRDYSSPPDTFHSMSATYGWNPNAVITGATNPQTGAWQSAMLDDQGNLKVAINGDINITGVTVNQTVLEGYAQTGNVLTSSGNAFLASISGRLNNGLIGVTGTRPDVASGYATGYYLMVGGRAVEIASGFAPQYGSGANAMLNIARDNGALLTQPTDLNYIYDAVTAYPPQSTVVSNSTISGAFATTSIQTGIALFANTGRKSFFIQNTSNVAPLYVKFGAPPVTTGSFSLILNPSSTAGQGGGSFNDDHYLGQISISGNSFISWELT